MHRKGKQMCFLKNNNIVFFISIDAMRQTICALKKYKGAYKMHNQSANEASFTPNPMLSFGGISPCFLFPSQYIYAEKKNTPLPFAVQDDAKSMNNNQHQTMQKIFILMRRKKTEFTV
jgi:hypothetical protein